MTILGGVLTMKFFIVEPSPLPILILLGPSTRLRTLSSNAISQFNVRSAQCSFCGTAWLGAGTAGPAQQPVARSSAARRCDIGNQDKHYSPGSAMIRGRGGIVFPRCLMPHPPLQPLSNCIYNIANLHIDIKTPILSRIKNSSGFSGYNMQCIFCRMLSQ